MEPKKDFDFEEFEQFMKHLSGIGKAIELERRARTVRELEMMDELEVEVAGRPCYNSVDEIINAVKEM
jgi:hypothetical protein